MLYQTKLSKIAMFCLLISSLLATGPDSSYSDELEPFFAAAKKYAPRTGVYVLEKGEEALLARAWLTDWAKESIDVQYFIWSTDNIGVLAAEALLRAADRGVNVRVVVDDLMIDAPPISMIALAAHPNIQIRVYNPVHKTGVSQVRRLFNVLTDFRNVNQRMHDKTFVVDSMFAVTGGRNMADEYYDYNQDYNFRDRDLLVMGPVIHEMQSNFENFWVSPLSVPVEELLKFQKMLTNERRISEARSELHAYAQTPDNFAPQVRQVLRELPQKFPKLLERVIWTDATFLYDMPGKNSGEEGLGGGGRITSELAKIVRGATESVTIQSPYLVLPEGTLKLFQTLVKRGVEVRISTNSLGSTDNLMAFSGYRKQRHKILEAGVQIFEFKPQPKIQQELVERYPELIDSSPVFAVHAKTMVVDGRVLYVGTFNLDPRSANLNTEVGILLENTLLAGGVEAEILKDMLPENSWRADVDDPDAEADLSKRLRLRLWRLLPIDALL